MFLFSSLPPDEATRLLAEAPPPCTYGKGETVLPPAQEHALGILLSGELLVRPPGESGLIKRLTPGEAFGAAALFSAADTTYVTDLVAAAPSEVLFLPEPLLLKWMRTDFRVAENYLRFLSDRVRFLNRRLSALTADSAEKRLLRFLRHHKADDNGAHTFAGGMSELAARLDMGRTTLYRALQALEKTGHLRRARKSLYLTTKGYSS